MEQRTEQRSGQNNGRNKPPLTFNNPTQPHNQRVGVVSAIPPDSTQPAD
jgi:hypothetical protein